MSRVLLSLIVVAAIAAGAYYYLNRPEPTPAERFEAAVQDAGEALNEAAEAAADATTSAVEKATDKAAETATNLSEEAAAMTEQAEAALDSAVERTSEQMAAGRQQVEALIQSWQEQGALTEGGFNYDSMVKAVESSTLPEEAKAQLLKILEDIKAAPETFAAKIEELRELVAQ